MANARAIVKRRKSVRNIRKITRTMQLIATARFQSALNRVLATKPYADKLAELVTSISDAASGDVAHPLLKTNDEADHSAVVILTSNRGLCGGYNAGVLRTALEHLKTLETERHTTNIHMTGKKGVNYFRFLKREMEDKMTNLGDSPRFEQVEPLANRLMDQFATGALKSVHVVYVKFISTSQQQPTVMQLLPLSRQSLADTNDVSSDMDAGAVPQSSVEYEFSPEPEKLLGELLPATVRIRLFQCFTDAVVCEQVARMVAMKAATDAAGDMITTLTRQYNRARQTQITMELLDIVGGVNALS